MEDRLKTTDRGILALVGNQRVFFQLGTAQVDIFEQLGNVVDQIVPKVLEQIRPLGVNRSPELRLRIFNKIEEFTRELLRPAVVSPLILVHRGPGAEDVPRQEILLILDQLDGFVVRMLRIGSDLIGRGLLRFVLTRLARVLFLNFVH